MNKASYLAQIRQLLQSLPEEDRERSLAFYAESIDDRIEDGRSEEEAVASLESPEEAARTILMEKFPNAHYEIHLLSPAFITQGGPGCVAVQVVKG